MADTKTNPVFFLQPLKTIWAKGAGPTSEQTGGKLTSKKNMEDTRFRPQKRGKYEVGSGKLHRKGFGK